jgi:beta-lactamase superfamily II metal-dependent hydrolase
VFYYLILWLLVSSLGSKRKPFLFSALILANLFLWGGAFSREDQTLRVSILDAGSGAATVLESPGGKTFAINAGEKTENLDAGEFIVVPFLNHDGIKRLEGLILTDRDAPNLTSALSVAQNKHVERLFIQHEDYLANEGWRDLTERLQIMPLFLDSINSIVDTKNGFDIGFLVYPQPGGLGTDSRQILVKIEYQDVSICLLDGTKRIRFSQPFDWQQVRNCSLLVLSELGSEDDIRQIISAVRPAKIVFTRHYLLYQQDKIPLLMASSFPQIEYHRTAQGGAMICQTDGKEIEIKPTLP